MFVLKGSIIFLLLVVVPFLLGILITDMDATGVLNSAVEKYLLGIFTSVALFWTLCLPMTLLRISFTTLTITYSCCLVLLCGIAGWILFKKGDLKKRWIKRRKLRLNHFELIYLLIFLAFLGIQLYYAARYEATIWTYDDATYVVQSLDTITSDHMFSTWTVTGGEIDFSYKYALTSWPVYIAYLSKVSGFHVATIAHTILPVVLLLLAYLVYDYIAGRLFERREDKLIFLCVLSVACMFGLYSPYSLTFRLLVTLWQGKAVVSAILIPFLIAFLPKVYMCKKSVRIFIYLLILSMAACSFTLMGAGMTIAVYIGMWLVFVVYRRRLAGMWYCFCGCIIPAVQAMAYLILR